MRPITIRLTTPAGDEIGRLDLEDQRLADPEDAVGESFRSPGAEMTEFRSAIKSALDREGLDLACDSVDFRLRVSDAVLAEAGTPVLIHLPVRDGGSGHPAGPGPAPFDPLSEDLFDYDPEDCDA